MRLLGFVSVLSILLVSKSVDSFIISEIKNTVKAVKQTVKAVKTAGKIVSLLKNGVMIFDDVHLPKSVSYKERLNSFLDMQSTSVVEQEGFILAKLLPDQAIESLEDDLSLDNYSALVGTPRPTKETMTKPRAKAFLQVYTEVIDRLIETGIDKYDVMPCEGYLYFGNKDFTKILPELCKCNPFFATALTVSGDNDEYLELNSQDDSRYATVVQAMMDKKIKCKNINVRFNSDDMSINEITNYDSGRPVIVSKEDWNYYAIGACYSVYYHGQCVHALIHVLHHLMTAGINLSTAHDESLHAWAKLYDDNITLKYIEVALLLYPSNLPVEDKDKVLTGERGFGGTKGIMGEMRKLL